MIIVSYKSGLTYTESFYRSSDKNRAVEHYKRVSSLPFYSGVEFKEY